MERNLRLLIAYDGTDFHGWQTQPGLRTVQECIEQALRRVLRHPLNLQGASRTDAGVHARGQVANVRTGRDIPCDNIRRAVGGRIPRDISIRRVDEVPAGFRASRDPICKLYRYRIHNDTHRPVENHLQRYTYHCWHRLDVDRMHEAAQSLVGEHDFAAFASAGHQRQTTVRTILRLDVHRHYREIRIDVEGTGFLYNQVRNIVGTLVEIGRGHWPIDKMPEILASCDRSQAGPTAPALGLCLQWLKYDLLRPYPVPDDDWRRQPGADGNPDAPKADASGDSADNPEEGAS